MNRIKVSKKVITAAFGLNLAIGLTIAGAQVAKKPPVGQAKGPLGADKAAPAAPPVAKVEHHKGKDPFYIPWTVPPPPPYVFDSIVPVRVADEEIEAPPKDPVTVREEPTLRVSGIMTGDGVFAILEQSGGKVDIVKPGSSVDVGNGRNYIVTSIKGDTVILESKDGLVTYQQTVPLSDAPVGTTSASFGGGAPTGPGRGAMGPGSFGGGAPTGPGRGAMGPGSFGGGRIGGGKKGGGMMTPGGAGGGGGFQSGK
jgi:hypothetical protein